MEFLFKNQRRSSSNMVFCRSLKPKQSEIFELYNNIQKLKNNPPIKNEQ